MTQSMYSRFDLARRTIGLFTAVGLRAGVRGLQTFSTVSSYTMVGRKRLETLYRLGRSINESGVPGDIVECGVWNGGTAAVLASAGMTDIGRRLWLFDSFEGLPEPTQVDGERAKSYEGKLVASVVRVQEVLSQVGAPLDRVEIVKGWFEDTFPTVEIPQIALLHVDADWYASVKLALERFYDAVQPGGYIVFDDYGYWQGCKKAVDEFMVDRGVNADLREIDSRAVYLQKI